MRNFTWFCRNCETILSIETRERREDDDRDVRVSPEDLFCPMCGKIMWDVDDITARDPTVAIGIDDWAMFDRWRKKWFL